MNLSDGLVEFWTFNDTLVGVANHQWTPGNTVTDSQGTESGYVSGLLGKAWRFFNTNYHLSCHSLGNPFAGGDWTVALWQRPGAEDPQENGGDCLGIWSRVLPVEECTAFFNDGLGWEPPISQPQTLKQHLIVSPSGIIQPVGSSIIVPGWV